MATLQSIEAEADTLDEAREQVKSKIPEGFFLVSEKIVSDGNPKMVKTFGATLELALGRAEREVPPNAVILEKKETAPAQKPIRTTVIAFDEQSAKSNAERDAKRQSNNQIILQSARLTVAGSKGFLGIIKKPSQYEIVLLENLPATVEIFYKSKAKIIALAGNTESLPRQEKAENDTSVKGRVFRSDTNQPLIGATVLLLNPALSQDDPAFEVAEVNTDSEGNYIIPKIKPGKYQMTFFAFCNTDDLPFDISESEYILTIDKKWLLTKIPLSTTMININGMEQEIIDEKASIKTFEIAAGEVLRKDIDLRCR